MALAIRLARHGAKKRPFYRIVVADRRMPRDGRFIEKLGHYDPMLASDNPQRVALKTERLQHWLKIGAQPSARVHSFLAKADIIPARPIPEQTKQHRPRARTLERLKERQQAQQAASAAKQQEKQAEKPPEQQPEQQSAAPEKQTSDAPEKPAAEQKTSAPADGES